MVDAKAHMATLSKRFRCWRIGPFGSAVMGAFVGGLVTFITSWWLVTWKDAQERQAAACVLAGELQAVHVDLQSAVSAGGSRPEEAIGALQGLRIMKIDLSSSSWGLAAKLDPRLAREISNYRAGLASMINMLEFPANAPLRALPVAQTILTQYATMAAGSEVYAQKLQAICDQGVKP